MYSGGLSMLFISFWCMKYQFWCFKHQKEVLSLLWNWPLVSVQKILFGISSSLKKAFSTIPLLKIIASLKNQLIYMYCKMLIFVHLFHIRTPNELNQIKQVVWWIFIIILFCLTGLLWKFQSCFVEISIAFLKSDK